ncbi:membrane associated rhomboid family serine protease [Allocatelliglobosispora scoriae]|uniref:Membrane associated rhomboid family serine protease n=1 Tax=Allocatelliglobosispora scoriae TaxID=643052 RepID=A0A841C5I2_9ACTN|nr:rhomboid family intramembrane serine protease [Allocatelliglobosispora scoriae]MBB5874332.1 membrane associated rhomboid family serine protease [Allocatelliglobosispora scoriae]
MRPFPRITAIVFVLTAVPSLLQIAYPALETNLRRDPALIADGQLWRLATSSLVQDSGVPGTISNLLFLLVLGCLAERVVGPGRWVLFFLSGVALGQVGGLLFDTVGAGSSIGLCGLVGGMAVAAWRGRDPLPAAIGALYAFLLVGAAVDAVWSYAAAVAASGLIIALRHRVPRWAYPLVVGGVGIGLAVTADLHGPALLGGLVAGGLADAKAGAWSFSDTERSDTERQHPGAPEEVRADLDR